MGAAWAQVSTADSNVPTSKIRQAHDSINTQNDRRSDSHDSISCAQRSKSMSITIMTTLAALASTIPLSLHEPKPFPYPDNMDEYGFAELLLDGKFSVRTHLGLTYVTYPVAIIIEPAAVPSIVTTESIVPFGDAASSCVSCVLPTYTRKADGTIAGGWHIVNYSDKRTAYVMLTNINSIAIHSDGSIFAKIRYTVAVDHGERGLDPGEIRYVREQYHVDVMASHLLYKANTLPSCIVGHAVPAE